MGIASLETSVCGVFLHRYRIFGDILESVRPLVFPPLDRLYSLGQAVVSDCFLTRTRTSRISLSHTTASLNIKIPSQFTDPFASSAGAVNLQLGQCLDARRLDFAISYDLFKREYIKSNTEVSRRYETVEKAKVSNSVIDTVTTWSGGMEVPMIKLEAADLKGRKAMLHSPVGGEGTSRNGSFFPPPTGAA